MYAFDLLCATFTLASMWAYVRGRIVLSVVFFWLSIKSKEVTIFFPLVLAAYELLLSGRGFKDSWRRLLPFFAISAVVGGFAISANTGRDNAYSLRFTWAALGNSIRYYTSQVALIPYAGLALLVVALVARSRKVWFGLLTFVLLLGPMFFLPGRLFAAYLYVPMIGLAIALSAATRWVWLAAFFVLWIPWNYQQFRLERRAAQSIAEQRRQWFATVEALVRSHPEIDTFVYDGTPESMPHHAIAGALRLLRPGTDPRVVALPQGWDLLKEPHLAVLVWDEPRMRLHVMPRVPDAAYVAVDEEAPLWQLTSGWVGNQGHFRWMRPLATVRLHRPAGVRELEVVVVVVLRGVRERTLALSLDGNTVGTIRLTKEGVTTFRLPVPPAGEGSVTVELRASPPIPNPTGDGELGQPMGSVGFVCGAGTRDCSIETSLDVKPQQTHSPQQDHDPESPRPPTAPPPR